MQNQQFTRSSIIQYHILSWLLRAITIVGLFSCILALVPVGFDVITAVHRKDCANEVKTVVDISRQAMTTEDALLAIEACKARYVDLTPRVVNWLFNKGD